MTDNNSAYGFFDSNVLRERLERDLPGMTPGGLETKLWLVPALMKDPRTDPDLREFAGASEVYPTYPSEHRWEMPNAVAKKLGDLKYAVEASIPGQGVEAAGELLKDVMNGIYVTYHSGQVFTVAIVGKVDEQYYFWED